MNGKRDWAVSASILSCRHTAIGEGVRRAEAAGAGFIHIDIMDGDYVDNMTVGPKLFDELKEICSLPLSVHLETGRPERFFRLFRETGADVITFQTDACSNPLHLIGEIKKSGKQVGAAIGPAYGIESVRYILPYLDYVNVMSVEPGYAGQRFEPSVYGKLRELRALLTENGYGARVSVDGGVNAENIPLLLEAGADILICGSSAFQNDTVEENIARLLHAGGA